MLPPKKRNSVNSITVLTGEKNPTGDVIAPTSSSINYTEKNKKTRIARNNSGFKGSENESVKVDKAGLTTAKPFTRTVVKSPGGYVRILGNDRTVIAEGRDNTKSIQDAIKASKNKVADVNDRRNKQERSNNLTGGLANNVTRKEYNQLSADGQSTGNPKEFVDLKLQKARDKEREIHNITEQNAAKKKAIAEALKNKDKAKTEAARVLFDKERALKVKLPKK